MMTADSFRQSLSESAPPAGLDLALQGLWWAARDDWERAHGCVQQNEGDPRCDWVHAYLHRVEGDLGNAGYWYRRVRRTMPSGSLDSEWSDITTHLLAE